MAKPAIHSESSRKRFGGEVDDYIKIHNTMDSSKEIIPDNRHRCIFHSSFGIFIMEKIFGMNFSSLGRLKEKHKWSDEEIEDIIKWKNECIENGTAIKNSNNKEVQVRDISEQHILEDFGMKYIPTAQDYIENMDFKDWMQNGKGYPSSHTKIFEKRKTKISD